MTRFLLCGVSLLCWAGFLVAQEKAATETRKVEVFFATDNVPKNAKAGDRVDLKMVLGKTNRPRGGALYQTRLIAGGLEIAKVELVKDPVDPANPVRVELLLPNQTAEKLQKIQEQKVEVIENTDDGRVVKKTVPIPLRLEPTKPKK